MARTRPEAGCHDLAFQAAYSVDEAGEVALEDYARALCRAGAAEAVRPADDAAKVTGLHLCDVGPALTPAVATDVEDFARDLGGRSGTGGLGWS